MNLQFIVFREEEGKRFKVSLKILGYPVIKQQFFFMLIKDVKIIFVVKNEQKEGKLERLYNLLWRENKEGRKCQFC